MHIYFSGIGGAGLGPLALLARQAGYEVSGSDKQDSDYLKYLREHGIDNIHVGQTIEQIDAVHRAKPINWFVYSSAVRIENPDAPELRYCAAKHIRESKRDNLLSTILADKNQQLIAIAGTHGKTTTTAMTIWLLQRLGIPVSYVMSAKISFGDMAHFDPASKYFVYEADEFDRNFLSFEPFMSIITGIDWDHHDIYPTREEYEEAFREFVGQSKQAVIWQEDAAKLRMIPDPKRMIVDKLDEAIGEWLQLPGPVNRQDAWQVATAIQSITNQPLETLMPHLNAFPGAARRFEQITPGLYSDYAHTPPKIRGALETAREVAKRGGNEVRQVVVVYEGLHNTRQHFIKHELQTLFAPADKLYIVPTYLAREDQTLRLLSPADLRALMDPQIQAKTLAATLDTNLEQTIRNHLKANDLVVCISAGGGGSLDEWARKTFAAAPTSLVS